MEKEVDVKDELSTEGVVEETVEITPMLGSTTDNVVASDNGKKDDAIAHKGILLTKIPLHFVWK